MPAVTAVAGEAKAEDVMAPAAATAPAAVEIDSPKEPAAAAAEALAVAAPPKAPASRAPRTNRRAAAPKAALAGTEDPKVRRAARPASQPQATLATAAAKRRSLAMATATASPRASAKPPAPPQILPSKPRLPRSGKSILDGLGVPVFGARHGSVEKVDWAALAAEHRHHPIKSFLRHRRWVYATAATDRLLVAVAIVDGGLTGTAFCMITDLQSGETIANSSRPGGSRPLVSVSDHPMEGLVASYRLPGTEYRIQREHGSHETKVSVRLRNTSESLPGLRWVPGIGKLPILRDLPTASARPWLDIDLTLESTVAPPLTAISQVDADGGLVTSTIKTAAMNTWGTITLHGQDQEAPHTMSLDGGTGAMDYTNGFLPRHTSWQWASTTGRLEDGRLFGLNLVSQFSGIGDDTAENAVWLDGALVPLDSRARVLLDKSDLTKPWTVRTVDGAVHLHFQPLTIHREGLNLGIIRSRFVQPTGLFTGHVMVEGERVLINRMPGVVEDQDILW